MAGLERRLERLEELANSKRPTEEYEMEHCLLRARIDRNHSMDSGARHARSLIRLFRYQGMLSGMSADELIERIVSWRPVPDGGWLRSTAEREVAPAIYNQEPGRENMACPSRWCESLLAGVELCAKVAAIPDQEIGRTADAVAQS
jgi:hypothetical protein